MTVVRESQIPRVRQHSVGRSILLHLLPGALILAFYVIAAPVTESLGAPSFLALLLAIAFILLPFELGYLLVEARRRNGSFSLEGVVLYRRPMSGWQYAAWGIPLFLWVGLIFAFVTPPIDKYLMGTLFSALPDWFFILSFTENMDAYSQSALLVIAVLALLLNGLVGPIVEELYFRGYLLPRISRLGGWAPLFNIVFFSLYHFFSPWQNPGRILAMTPLYYAVWWKKNIYLGMIVHCAANFISGVLMLALVLG
jgi:membrane protease YdiL (CAAX protease family)